MTQRNMIVDETFDDSGYPVLGSEVQEADDRRRYQLRSNQEKFKEVDNSMGTRWERERESPDNE